MENIRFVFGKSARRRLGKMPEDAEKKGGLRGAERITEVSGVSEGLPYEVIASALNTEKKTVIRRVGTLLLKGPAGLESRKSPGRKAKLTKSQKKDLSAPVSRGPAEAGFPGNCRRSPMIQALIYKKSGVFYAVNHISGLPETWGFHIRKPVLCPPAGTVTHAGSG